MIRPVDVAPSQLYGDNPTKHLPADHWIIQRFGNYQPDGHTGEDYPCPAGTPVRAVTSGTVRHVGWLAGSYADNPWWIAPGFAGYVYVVDHGAFIGIYGHCLDGGTRVRAGQRVAEGQVLGPSGNTGASTGDHLHFEVLPDGYILNSYMYGRINPADLFKGVTPQSSQELFTMGQYEEVQRQQGLTHEKLNNIAAAFRAANAQNQKYHSQSHAKMNAVQSVVDQIAAGQGVEIDWARVEEAAKKGAAEALADGIVKVDVSVQGQGQ